MASASVVRIATASPWTETSATPGSASSTAGSGPGVAARSVRTEVLALIWVGVPSAITRPWLITRTRLALASASSM